MLTLTRAPQGGVVRRKSPLPQCWDSTCVTPRLFFVVTIVVVLFCFSFYSDSEHGNFETKSLCLAMVILERLTFWP